MTGRTARATLATLGVALWVGRGIDLGPVDLQPVQVVGALIGLALLSTTVTGVRPLAWLQPRSARDVAALALAFTAVVTAAGFSAIDAQEPFSIVRFIARYLLGLVLLVSVLHFLQRPRNARVLERALLAGAILSVALSAAGYLVPSLATITIRYGDRAQGLLNHPNQLAMLLIAVAPLAIAVALEQPRRIGPWIRLLVICSGVAMSGSKANLAMLVFLLPTIGLLAAQLQRGAFRRLGMASALVVAAVLAVSVMWAVVRTANPRTLTTLERLLTEPVSTTAVASRLDMWQVALDRALDSPWFGVGADHTAYYLPYSHAHNVFVEYFLTMGMTGLIALIVLLTALAFPASRALFDALTRTSLTTGHRLRLLALPMGTAAYVAASQSSDSFGGTTLPILWLLAALTIAELDHGDRLRNTDVRQRHVPTVPDAATTSTIQPGRCPT